ncbi:glycosyltransferase [Sporolactobacillus sp. THM7-4]|nr:glycosyltransferase [Sporolactobacillus sp. THM7-4]
MKVSLLKKIHVIVATGEWKQDQLRYRRHRLAEFLKKQPDTQEVIWLCPTPSRHEQSSSTLENGIVQWTVQDPLPQKVFRFGRFKDPFYKGKLRPLIAHLRLLKKQAVCFLWYTFPGFPLLGDLFPWDKVIYDCSDLWASPISGRKSFIYRLRQKLIAQAEGRIIERADTIFCTSDYLKKQVIDKTGPEKAQQVHTLENGVEFNLFTDRSLAEGILPEGFSGTVLGYIGGIKPKLDFELIRRIAEKRRDWLFLFVGPDGTGGQGGFRQLLSEENVVWTGSVPPRDVPKYMNLTDIGMMPYKPSPYNEAVFPLKLFEFLAAGKPAIGVHLPSTRKYAEKGVYTCLDTSDPETFIRACEQMESIKEQEAYIDKRISLARMKNWTEIFREMTDLIK